MAAPVMALGEHVAAREEPRRERTKRPPLLGIIVIVLCAVICGAKSWNDIDIAEFGEAQQE